jgi:hypothetical protein
LLRLNQHRDKLFAAHESVGELLDILNVFLHHLLAQASCFEPIGGLLQID